jgi:hypothetical protein
MREKNFLKLFLIKVYIRIGIIITSNTEILVANPIQKPKTKERKYVKSSNLPDLFCHVAKLKTTNKITKTENSKVASLKPAAIQIFRLGRSTYINGIIRTKKAFMP